MGAKAPSKDKDNTTWIARPRHEIRRHQAQRRPDPSARLAVCRITAFAEVSYCEYPLNEWQLEGIKSRKVIATVSFLCSRVERLRTYRGALPLHVVPPHRRGDRQACFFFLFLFVVSLFLFLFVVSFYGF